MYVCRMTCEKLFMTLHYIIILIQYIIEYRSGAAALYRVCHVTDYQLFRFRFIWIVMNIIIKEQCP